MQQLVWRRYLNLVRYYCLTIIVTLLSAANAKYLIKYFSQNIFLLLGYIFPRSIWYFGEVSGRCRWTDEMNNVYGQKCLSHNLETRLIGHKWNTLDLFDKWPTKQNISVICSCLTLLITESILPFGSAKKHFLLAIKHCLFVLSVFLQCFVEN